MEAAAERPTRVVRATHLRAGDVVHWTPGRSPRIDTVRRVLIDGERVLIDFGAFARLATVSTLVRAATADPQE